MTQYVDKKKSLLIAVSVFIGAACADDIISFDR